MAQGLLARLGHTLDGSGEMTPETESALEAEIGPSWRAVRAAAIVSRLRAKLDVDPARPTSAAVLPRRRGRDGDEAPEVDPVAQPTVLGAAIVASQTAPRPAPPRELPERLARHAANVRRLWSFLQQGARRTPRDQAERLISNMCQWIVSSGIAVHALTDTLDPYGRAKQLGGPANSLAAFGCDVAIPHTSDYDWEDETSRRNIIVLTQEERAGPILRPGKIHVLEPNFIRHDHDLAQFLWRRLEPAMGRKVAATPGGVPAGVIFALDRHARDVARLWSFVQKGRKRKSDEPADVALANACEWIASGAIKIYALTATHDAVERAEALGHPGLQAYFGWDVPAPALSTYDWQDRTSARNVFCDSMWVGGRARAGQVWFGAPGNSRDEHLAEILLHEVTHATDGWEKESSPRSSYESEFDARWLEGRFAGQSETSLTPAIGAVDREGTQLTAEELNRFDNDRQRATFLDVLHPEYAYVARSWKHDPEFRAFVFSHRRPRGENLLLSPRVEQLRQAAVARDFDRAVRALEQLDDSDRGAIRAPAARLAWVKLLQEFPLEQGIALRRMLGIDSSAPLDVFHRALDALAGGEGSYLQALESYRKLSSRDMWTIARTLRSMFQALIDRLPEPHDSEFAGKLGLRAPDR